MRYIQRQNKECKQRQNNVNKDIYKGKQRQWDIQRQNKDVNKDNEIYTKAKQRCKQRQWDIYKG